MPRTMTTVGSLEKTLIRSSVHSSTRLVERFGVHPDKAAIIYARDTRSIRGGKVQAFTQGRIGGRIWWIEDDIGLRFPVTRFKHSRLIISTYLTADMVYETMMGE